MPAWDPVPWMVGGGAKHSVNVARNISHLAAGAREGVVSPTDCVVKELAVPGTQVRILPGTVTIQSRAAGVRDEMYVGRLPVTDYVDIAPTGSGSGRSDLIVARVEDPFMPGEPWGEPSDPAVGPYIFTRVISNVPAGTKKVSDLGLGYSAIALARIDIPDSTGTITQAMITDLRQMNHSQTTQDMNIVAPGASQTLSSAGFTNWPTAANFDVDVPSWATRCKVRVILAGIKYGAPGGPAANVVGQIRVQLGAGGNVQYGQPVTYNVSNDGGADRAVLMTGAPKLPIPEALRGRTATFRVEGLKSGGNNALVSDNQSLVSFDVVFYEQPEVA